MYLFSLENKLSYVKTSYFREEETKFKMDILRKIEEIEVEMSKTQKNKEC